MDDEHDQALLLVKLGDNDGGRVDPDRILRRPPTSHARRMFMLAQDAGWLDGEGWVTDAGRRALGGS
jgi:hypothetical protein